MAGINTAGMIGRGGAPQIEAEDSDYVVPPVPMLEDISLAQGAIIQRVAPGPITQYRPMRHQGPRIHSGPLSLSPFRSQSPASSDGGVLPIQDLPDYAALAGHSGAATFGEYVAPSGVVQGDAIAREVNELRERLRNEEQDAADNLDLARDAVEHQSALARELAIAESRINE